LRGGELRMGGSQKLMVHRKKKMRMPKLHTNLISTLLLREGHGIFLDEFTMQLQRGPNRECFAQLESHHRMTYNLLPEANKDAALPYVASKSDD